MKTDLVIFAGQNEHFGCEIQFDGAYWLLSIMERNPVSGPDFGPEEHSATAWRGDNEFAAKARARGYLERTGGRVKMRAVK